MNLKVKSSLKITGWAPLTDENDEIVDSARARIRKEFAGEMTGTSVANAILYQTPVKYGGYSTVPVSASSVATRSVAVVVGPPVGVGKNTRVRWQALAKRAAASNPAQRTRRERFTGPSPFLGAQYLCTTQRARV